MIDMVSKSVSTSTLVLFWQFILKGLDELVLVSNPLLSLEMLIFRLLHLKEMPSYDDLINNTLSHTDTFDVSVKASNKTLNEETAEIKTSKDQIKSTIQTKPDLILLTPKETNKESIKSFEDLIKLSSKKKEIELKYDLERHVNLIKFSVGKIDISFNEELGKNFVRNLSEKLLEWTGKRWVITLTRDAGQKSFIEKKSIERNQILNDEKKREVYKKFKNLFPDAELIEVSKED
jgi:DNA polymerase-3 subunit gamma/tau